MLDPAGEQTQVGAAQAEWQSQALTFGHCHVGAPITRGFQQAEGGRVNNRYHQGRFLLVSSLDQRTQAADILETAVDVRLGQQDGTGRLLQRGF